MSTYTIIDGEPTPEQYAVSSSTAATARRSLDETKVLLEWSGDTPASMSGLITYTHAEIAVAMKALAWSEPDPEL